MAEFDHRSRSGDSELNGRRCAVSPGFAVASTPTNFQRAASFETPVIRLIATCAASRAFTTG